MPAGSRRRHFWGLVKKRWKRLFGNSGAAPSPGSLTQTGDAGDGPEASSGPAATGPHAGPKPPVADDVAAGHDPLLAPAVVPPASSQALLVEPRTKEPPETEPSFGKAFGVGAAAELESPTTKQSLAAPQDTGEPLNKWAILIGIDKYTYEDSMPKRKRYTTEGAEMRDPRNLEGCVNDALAIRECLVNTMRLDPGNIKMLLAPVEGKTYRTKLPQGEYREATYENIVRALADIPRYARKNDLVFIHYSGHGAQASTVFAGLGMKRPHDTDHSLLPTDVALTGKYLRDVELGALLQDIVAAGIVLTVVLDCCHAGGAVRGEDDDDDDYGLQAVRADDQVYRSDPEVDFPLLSKASIERWGNTARWMEAPKGFVVLAACLDYQRAKEMADIQRDGTVVWHGRLTFWLLDTVRNSPLSYSSGAIYDRIRAKFQNTVRNQTPYLIGDNDRFFFGPKYRSKIYALSVRAVRRGVVELAGGRFHGVQQKAEYAILPLAFDLGHRFDEADVLAYVKVQRVESDTSFAAFIGAEADAEASPGPSSRRLQIGEGCPVVLQSLPLEACASVRFIAADDQRWQQFEQNWAQHSKSCPQRRLLRLLPREQSSGASDEDALFTVAVDCQGLFRLTDRPGMLASALAQGLRPLRWDAADSMAKLVRRLEHLTRFYQLKSLENPGFRSADLTGLVTVEVGPAPEGMWLADEDGDEYIHPADEDEISCQNGVYVVPERKLFRITVRNNADCNIGCTILNFTPEFGIDIVYPEKDHAPFLTIPSKEHIAFDTGVVIPEILREAAENGATVTDLFKVMVSKPERDVGCLRLAKLWEMEDGITRGEDTGGASVDPLLDDDTNGEEEEDAGIASVDSLDDLMTMLRLPMRNSLARARKNAGGDWQTKDIFVRALPSPDSK